jgi:hypothetical protein
MQEENIYFGRKENLMRSRCRMVLMLHAAAVIFGTMIENAHAAVIFTRQTAAEIYVTENQVVAKGDTIFKIIFEDKTSGTNLLLCAGTKTDYDSGNCAITLSTSAGPGWQYQRIIDGKTIQGKILFVIRHSGTTLSQFVLTIE